jgi:hypothetical protein
MNVIAESEKLAIATPVAADDVSLRPWTAKQRILFRIASLFVLQIVLPVQSKRWIRISHVRSVREAIMVLTPLPGERFGYVTIPGESGRWGIESYASMGIALAAAIVAGLIWTWFARNSPRKEYNKLYYWVRLAVRYFLALNMLDFGYEKLFPEQMPFPSIANLHTQFGEINAFRMYWHHVGLVTWYQVFLGFMELSAGLLLLFRSTTALGAVIIAGMLYNVAHANFAYDGGVHVFSSTVSILALFLFAQYVPNLYRLLIEHKDVEPWYYYPKPSPGWKRWTFYSIRAFALFVCLVLYGYVRHDIHNNTSMSKEPRTPGLAGAQGFYLVTEFVYNGKTLPYSPFDPIRWQNADFEEYSTFVYKVNRPFSIRTDNGADTFLDVEKRYEMAGFAGGRRYFHYDIDNAHGTLILQDKNEPASLREKVQAATAQGLPTKDMKWTPPQKLSWQFSRPSPGRIILSGVDEKKNTIYAVLDRVDEQQAIHIDSPVQGQPLHYDRVFYRRYPIHDSSFDGTGASSILGPK